MDKQTWKDLGYYLVWVAMWSGGYYLMCFLVEAGYYWLT